MENSGGWVEVDSLDQEARRVGVPRQALIKLWIADRLGGPGAQGPDESKAVEGHVRLRSGQLARWRSSFYETGPRYLPRRPVGVSGGDGGESVSA